MSLQLWLGVGGIVFNGLGLALIWAFKSGSFVKGTEDSSGALREKVASLERRMDQAGGKMSDFASELQGSEDRFRKIFMSLELGNHRFEESKDDRANIWREIRILTHDRDKAS